MKGVVFTFDDDLVSHYEVVAPTFEKFNFTCTFFLNANPRLKMWGESPLLNKDQIISLSKRGFEIGNHTHTHCIASKSNAPELKESITSLEDIFIDYKLGRSSTFCYPAYVSPSNSREVLNDLGFKLARIGYDKVEGVSLIDFERDNNPNAWERADCNYYTPGRTDRLEVPCCGLFCPSYDFEVFLSDLKKCPENGYCIFTGHLFHLEGSEVTYHPDSVSTKFLEKALNYCKENEVKVLRFQDLPL